VADVICPHCEEELELDNGASGDFECPLCGGEFEWEGLQSSSGNHACFDLNQYSVKKLIEIRLGKHYEIIDSNDQIIAYAWKRPFKLKEEIMITSDPEYQDCLISIKQTNIADAWGEFVFTTSEGSRIGSAKRKLSKSLIQETWEVDDASGKTIGEMRDDWAGKDLMKKAKANSNKLFSGANAPSFSIRVDGEEPIILTEKHSRLLLVNIPSRSTLDHQIIAAVAITAFTIAPVQSE
jgi:hypothetical protein